MPFVFGSLNGYRASWLRGDIVAGLTVWAVLVPEALAYAGIAGVSPVAGLYAAVPALVLYAALGSSRHLVVGPMSATAALSVAAVADLAKGGTAAFTGLTAALAVVTGVVGILAGLARLGFLASFISGPVLKGFIVGLALTIIAGQLPALFGVAKASGDFFQQVAGLAGHLGTASWLTLAIGLGSLAVVIALKRWVPVAPGSLVVAGLGIGAVAAFSLGLHGVDIVGHVQSGLPRVGLPRHVPAAADYLKLAGPAVGVLLVGFAEGLGAAKTYAARAGYEIDPSRELVGLGAANLGAGLASGMVVNGSLSKTAVNGGAGAKSQVSGLVVAALTVLTLLFLTGLFAKLPEATLAGIVIAAVVELVDIGSLRYLYRVWTSRLGSIYGRAARADFAAAVAALAGVLVFGTLPGLFIGIAVSLLLLLYRSSRPNVAVLGRVPGHSRQWADVARHPENQPEPGVVVVRVEAGLFFANADRVRDAVRALAAGASRAGGGSGAGGDSGAGGTGGVRAVVLDAETVPFIDVSAARMLAQLAADLRRGGVDLLLARDVGQVRDVLARTGAGAGLRSVYPDVNAAVAAATARRSRLR